MSIFVGMKVVGFDILKPGGTNKWTPIIIFSKKQAPNCLKMSFQRDKMVSGSVLVLKPQIFSYYITMLSSINY